MLRRRRLLAAAAVLMGGRAAIGQEARFLRIGTGGTTGTYYAIGSAIADLLSSPPGTPPCEQGGSCGVTGLVAMAQTSDGSIANLTAMAAGRIEAAIAQADLADAAYRGAGPFDGKPSTGLRVLANLYRENLHLVVRGDSDIHGVRDLVGRSVGLDVEGSGTHYEAQLVLTAFGLSSAQIIAHKISAIQAVTLMRAGRLDAAFMVGGVPLALVSELVSEIGASVVPIAGPEIDELVSNLHFLTLSTIPEGAYAGMPATPTISVGAQLYVRAELDEALVHAVTAALWRPENQAKLHSSHPKGQEINAATATDSLSLPLHPGAERYYREAGILRGP